MNRAETPESDNSENPSAEQNPQPTAAFVEQALPVHSDASSVRNFHQVTPWLFRGGQPTHDGFRELSRRGVKTVISFRWGARSAEAERQAVEAEGMEFISMPLNYWTLPNAKTIDRFFAYVDDPERRPIFVHCFHGSDRTGLLVALFRMAREGWTVKAAYQEMKKCGFHRFRIRHFKWVLWHYSRRAGEMFKVHNSANKTDDTAGGTA
jgi:protein tyrosine phosphatase (PTP) superfamily phosphohydrolase (DUF442 family)